MYQVAVVAVIVVVVEIIMAGFPRFVKAKSFLGTF